MWRKALLLTAALVFVGFGAVVISLFRWQIVRGEEMSIAALDQSLRSTTLSAMRGTIYDATGKVLAQSASVWTVVLEPAYFADYDDPEGTRQKVASGPGGHFWIWTRKRSTKKPRAALTLST